MTSQSPYVAPPPPPKKKRKIPIWAWIAGGVVIIVIIAAAASGGSKKKSDDTAATTPSTVPVSSAPAAAAPTKDAAPKPSPKPTPKLPDHSEDVAITGCAADPATGFLQANVTVTNHSSKTSNYAITIAFDSKDGSQQLDTGLIAVNDLNSGQNSPQTAVGLTQAPAAGYVCKVANITRYAS